MVLSVSARKPFGLAKKGSKAKIVKHLAKWNGEEYRAANRYLEQYYREILELILNRNKFEINETNNNFIATVKI